MSSSLTGSVSLSVAISDAITPGTGLGSYTIPINPTGLQATYSDGSGANSVHKAYQATLALAGATQAVDLTTAVCADGSTGFSHVREVIVINDATNSAYDLTLTDPSNTINYWLSGTTPTETIPAGSHVRHFKPLGTNGWVVDSTHKLITLDPGANTFQARVIVLGD